MIGGLRVSITKEDILGILKKVKPKYQQEGVDILGLFGSYAKDTQDDFSDVDIAYRLDYDKMAKQQDKDVFRVLFRIDEIRKELQELISKKVDFVPDKNEKILERIIYV